MYPTWRLQRLLGGHSAFAYNVGYLHAPVPTSPMAREKHGLVRSDPSPKGTTSHVSVWFAAVIIFPWHRYVNFNARAYHDIYGYGLIDRNCFDGGTTTRASTLRTVDPLAMCQTAGGRSEQEWVFDRRYLPSGREYFEPALSSVLRQGFVAYTGQLANGRYCPPKERALYCFIGTCPL